MQERVGEVGGVLRSVIRSGSTGRWDQRLGAGESACRGWSKSRRRVSRCAGSARCRPTGAPKEDAQAAGAFEGTCDGCTPGSVQSEHALVQEQWIRPPLSCSAVSSREAAAAGPSTRPNNRKVIGSRTAVSRFTGFAAEAVYEHFTTAHTSALREKQCFCRERTR